MFRSITARLCHVPLGTRSLTNLAMMNKIALTQFKLTPTAANTLSLIEKALKFNYAPIKEIYNDNNDTHNITYNPIESTESELHLDSVLRKRRLKMKKHKLRKRRREQRSLKKRLGKI